MTLYFTLPYFTAWGQRLVVCGAAPALGAWQLDQALPLTYDPGAGTWNGQIELAGDAAETVSYKYVLLGDDGGPQWEWGGNRSIACPVGPFAHIRLHDYWRAPAEPENELYTAAFTEALMRRAAPAPAPAAPAGNAVVRFQLAAPRVAPHQQLCVLGSDPALGAWDATRAVVLADAAYPTWHADVTLVEPDRPTLYKYGIWDPAKAKLAFLETGENRVVPPESEERTLRVRADERFRYPAGYWRGAGVAIPIFSLRSEQGLGVGEFTDLPLLMNWAVATGLQLVQVLPINDTTATHTWVDSYPYAAISVFALHPLYLNLEAVAKLKKPADRKELARLRAELNAQDFVDYEPVMTAKWRFIRLLYQQEKKAFLDSAEFQEFLREQGEWLVPYAAFSAWRDRFGTADFRQWPEQFQTPHDLAQRMAPTQADFDEFGVHFFTQFHLDKQLRAAVQYGRERGVVLKGDLPIGVYRHSVDVWTQPELYHLDQQAGAPPDDFSTTGQNWRFPTYNWARMAQDDYAWWKSRLGQLARYFDALRIDHILGFFRIWEIPDHSVEGLLGHFAPALPLHRDEIRQRLGWFDEGRLCAPYIRWHMLQDLFHEQAQAVFDEYMQDAGYGAIGFKPEVATQRQIEAYIDQKLAADPHSADHYRWLRTGLYQLVNEVLFLPAAAADHYHPRITLNKTYSFRELDGDEARRRLYDDIYVDFFYHRHNEFWREQGLTKLPPVRYATDMLIAGEDLGMVPASVPGVMKQLGILGLHIQRMPADPAVEFGQPDAAPYLSVVTTGSHDMSTLRGWWEEDRERTQRYFEHTLGHWGEQAPYYCEPWVVREIIVQHLHSPAMWAILPLQDLLGISTELRRENPQEEQINVPSNPTHFWKYRLHLNLEELYSQAAFNQELAQLVGKSGRDQTY